MRIAITVALLLGTGIATLPVAAATKVAPGSSMAFAAAAARSEQPKLAAKLYRDATRANPRDAAAWLGLGRALDADERLGEAVAALERAGELQPGLPGLARARGRSELRLGHLTAAETAFRAATLEEPGDTRSWVGLGVALDLQRRHADAQAAYAGALRADPLDHPARNNLALSVALQGRSAEAAALLEPWARNDDAPQRMRANLTLLQAAAAPARATPVGIDPALVTALRSLSSEPRR